jgi:hypothetical protein
VVKNPKRKGQKRMTKKHFSQVAEIIRKRAEQDSELGNGGHGLLSEMVSDFVELFQASNPRFNVAKFYEACGMDTEGEWLI